MLQPVIIAGGTGSRLWPLSRELNPKQFFRLTSSHQSILQQTISRLSGIDCGQPMLVCNEEHRFIAAEQIRQLGWDRASIILEPVGRNTAPAIALAALKLTEKGGNPLMLVLPADHLVENTAAFRESVAAAIPIAQAGKLVTFGVLASKPETGYGYIQRGTQLSDFAFTVERFVEKPDSDIAKAYMDSGEYYWNSGMFLFKAKRYLEELKTFCPQILKACQEAMLDSSDDMDFVRVNSEAFVPCPDDSIDYAVMEKTTEAAMVIMNAGWSDIGSWSALWETSSKDENGNALSGDSIVHNTSNTLVRADSRLVATVGVHDLIIVETKDALLVAHKDEVQEVKRIFERIKAECRYEHVSHREVYRPWGVYESIDNGTRYQVKRITVKPGAKLSVQMHHHRAEHWIVVSGTAQVTNGEQSYLVTENQSTFIPIGQVHALENPGVIDLELIEVQSGSYLGEDDIVRFEDRYGRA